MIKLCLRMGRPVTFPEMLEAIEDNNYLLMHRSIDHLVNTGMMTRETRKEGPWIHVFWPTLQGLEVYEGKHEQYKDAHFVKTIQKDLFS